MNAFADFAEFGFSVIGLAEAEVDEIGGDDVRGFECVVFGLAEGHVAGAQNLVDVFVKPAGVPEFEDIFAVLGKQTDEFGKDFQIDFEGRRELKEDGTEAAGGAQGFERIEEQARELFRIFELKGVSDLHVGLWEEHEVRLSGGDPLFKRGSGSNAAVSVIDLYRVEAR